MAVVEELLQDPCHPVKMHVAIFHCLNLNLLLTYVLNYCILVGRKIKITNWRGSHDNGFCDNYRYSADPGLPILTEVGVAGYTGILFWNVEIDVDRLFD
jgi:hypothetical protein